MESIALIGCVFCLQNYVIPIFSTGHGSNMPFAEGRLTVAGLFLLHKVLGKTPTENARKNSQDELIGAKAPQEGSA